MHQGAMIFLTSNLFFIFHSFWNNKNTTKTPLVLPPGPIIHISALLAFWTATLFQHIDDKYINRTHGTRLESSKNHMGKWYFLVFTTASINCIIGNILKKKKKVSFIVCSVLTFPRSHVLSLPPSPFFLHRQIGTTGFFGHRCSLWHLHCVSSTSCR